MHFSLKYCFIIFFTVVSIIGCKQIALYEQLKNIPGGEWKNNDTLRFSLDIPKDASYYIVATVRHTHMYAYRNIWVKLGLQVPGTDSVRFSEFDLPLANNEKWLGTGMNDVYERRIRLFDKPVQFEKAGKATFTLQHIMRQPALEDILQMGIRLEPVAQ